MSVSASQRRRSSQEFVELSSIVSCHRSGDHMRLVRRGPGNLQISGNGNTIGTARDSSGDVCITGDRNSIICQGSGDLEIVGDFNEIIMEGTVDSMRIHGSRNDIQIRGSVGVVRNNGSANRFDSTRDIPFESIEEEMENMDIARLPPTFRRRNANERVESRQSVNDARRSIDLLPNSTPTTLEIDQKKSCGICTIEYKSDSEMLTLPCFHRFHKECAEKWLAIKQECPLCRHPIRRMTL